MSQLTGNEWFAGNGDQQRRKLREEILDGETQDKSQLFDQMFIGVTALRIMSGVGKVADAPLLLATMIADCEIKIREESVTMLAAVDPGSPEARKAHFEARVAAEIVGMLNQYIRRGAEAQDAINGVTNE